MTATRLSLLAAICLVATTRGGEAADTTATMAAAALEQQGQLGSGMLLLRGTHGQSDPAKPRQYTFVYVRTPRFLYMERQYANYTVYASLDREKGEYRVLTRRPDGSWTAGQSKERLDGAFATQVVQDLPTFPVSGGLLLTAIKDARICGAPEEIGGRPCVRMELQIPEGDKGIVARTAAYIDAAAPYQLCRIVTAFTEDTVYTTDFLDYFDAGQGVWVPREMVVNMVFSEAALKQFSQFSGQPEDSTAKHQTLVTSITEAKVGEVPAELALEVRIPADGRRVDEDWGTYFESTPN